MRHIGGIYSILTAPAVPRWSVLNVSFLFQTAVWDPQISTSAGFFCKILAKTGCKTFFRLQEHVRS